jgi:hypothetical protein
MRVLLLILITIIREIMTDENIDKKTSVKLSNILKSSNLIDSHFILKVRSTITNQLQFFFEFGFEFFL